MPYRLEGQSTDPVDLQRALALVDRAVDLQRASALCIQDRSTGRSTGDSTVIKMTVGQSTGRAELPFAAANGQICFWAIYTHFFGLFHISFSRAKILIFLSVLATSFLKSFRFKRSIFICLKVLEISKKNRVFWVLVFDLNFYIYLEIFFKYFSLFQTLYFLTLELSIYPIY